MVRQCEICNYTFDISEIYVGRRQRNWPKCMCKNCSKQYNPIFKYYEKPIYKSKKTRSPLDILIEAGYPKNYALQIINKGL